MDRTNKSSAKSSAKSKNKRKPEIYLCQMYASPDGDGAIVMPDESLQDGKRELFFQFLFVVLSLLLFIPNSTQAQTSWVGTTSSGVSTRTGNTGILTPGTTTPAARLHIMQDQTCNTIPTGQVPELRLSRKCTDVSGTPAHNWDFTVAGNNLGLKYNYNSGTAFTALNIGQTSSSLGATKLFGGTGYDAKWTIGDATSATNSAQNAAFIGFGVSALSNAPGGSMYQFYGTATDNGGVVLQGDRSGNFFILNKAPSATANLQSLPTAVKFMVNNAGQVGINTTAFQANDKLLVSGGNLRVQNAKLVMTDANGNHNAELLADGTVHARRVDVDLNTIVPDYVFDDNYNLMALPDLKNYISKEKHLPGVKSAAEYEEAGKVDLGELMLKLLEKTEELTLYVLEADNRIKALESKIQTLENKN